ncbi:hypothetical protein ABIB60_000101 [Hymenobacter sp. UYP22]
MSRQRRPLPAVRKQPRHAAPAANPPNGRAHCRNVRPGPRLTLWRPLAGAADPLLLNARRPGGRPRKNTARRAPYEALNQQAAVSRCKPLLSCGAEVDDRPTSGRLGMKAAV